MDTAFIDFYKILGIEPKARSQEVKSAYRKMARKHHPDSHTISEKATAEEKFKEVNEAYAVLGDADNPPIRAAAAAALRALEDPRAVSFINYSLKEEKDPAAKEAMSRALSAFNGTY